MTNGTSPIVSRLLKWMEGKSRADFAAIWGIKLATINGWVAKGREPKVDAIVTICKADSISANWLLLDRGDKAYDETMTRRVQAFMNATMQETMDACAKLEKKYLGWIYKSAKALDPDLKVSQEKVSVEDVIDRLLKLVGNEPRIDCSKRWKIKLGTINRWLARDRKPKVDAIVAICRADSISADWLLLGRGDKVYDEEAIQKVQAYIDQGLEEVFDACAKLKSNHLSLMYKSVAILGKREVTTEDEEKVKGNLKVAEAEDQKRKMEDAYNDFLD